MSIPYGMQLLPEDNQVDTQPDASDTSFSLLNSLCDISCRFSMTDSLLLLCMAVEAQVESAITDVYSQTASILTRSSHEIRVSPEPLLLTTELDIYCAKHGHPRWIVQSLLQSRKWKYRQMSHQQPILYHLLGKDAQDQGDLAYHVFFLLQELVQPEYNLFTYQPEQAVYSLAKAKMKRTIGRLQIYLLIGSLLYTASIYRLPLPVRLAPSVWESLPVPFSETSITECTTSARESYRIQAEFARFSVKMSLENPIWMIRYPFLTTLDTMMMAGSDQPIFPTSQQHLTFIMRQQQQGHKKVYRLNL